MTAPRALKCPGCGGTVSAPLSSRRTECHFCGKPLYYGGEEFLARYVLASKLDDAAVHRACRTLFSGAYIPRDLGQRALLLEKRQTFVPFYLLTGKRGGVIAAGKERVVKRLGASDMLEFGFAPGYEPVRGGAQWKADKVEVIKEEDSRVVLGDFQYLYPACALEHLDILDVDVRQTMLEHLGDASAAYLSDLVRSADVLDADIPLDRIVEKGVESIQKTGELSVLEMQTVLLYLPLVTLTFRYGRHVFSVTLEEVGGTWVSGRLPFRRDLAFLVGLGLVSLVALFVGRLGNALLSLLWEKGPAHSSAAEIHFLVVFFLVVGLCLTVLTSLGLSAAWVLVRAPCRVRLGHGGTRVEAAGPIPESPLAPVNALLKWLVTAFLEAYASKRGQA